MSLSAFLADSKQRYLKAVQEGNGREWIVAMGNEAGDLDTVASSIAYAWFASTVQKTSCVTLLQTSRNDLKLRPENILAYSLASLSSSQEELLCIDDIPSLTPFPSNQFALVDHNRLLPRFSDKNEDFKVVAVLDHHDDEGLYKDTANPRTIIVPTGSASSIVARYIEQSSTVQILPEVARLLLCAILVDTSGLKPGGKAEELDHMAVSYLLPRSNLGTVSTSDSHENDSVVSALTNELMEKKFDVAQLSTMDLLRRDYKQFAWTAEKGTVQVGLSTVPLDLRIWFARASIEDFWCDVDTFMNDHKLDVLGVLTTFHDREEAEDGKKELRGSKGKHRRQVLMMIRDVPEELEGRLRMGLESASVLDLEPRTVFKLATKLRKGENCADIPMDAGVGGRRVYAYKQGNAKASRKIIAPLMRQIIEGEPEAA